MLPPETFRWPSVTGPRPWLIVMMMMMILMITLIIIIVIMILTLIHNILAFAIIYTYIHRIMYNT